MYDAIIIGGGAAGLSAALTLGRFRRKVLIFDAGQPRNAPASHAHNFFTQDGTPPAELLRLGREQLAPYDTVQFCHERVTRVEPNDAGFELHSEQGTVVQTKKLLLATGVADQLPDLPGVAEFWGKHIHHCPYCHGWEVADQPVAVIGSGDAVAHLAPLLAVLASHVTVCPTADAPLSAEQEAQLTQAGIAVAGAEPVAVEGDGDELAGVRLDDGRLIACTDVFVQTKVTQRSSLAADLGCEISEQGFVTVDVIGRATVPNVYAAGDMMSPLHQIVEAAASGMRAGAALNSDLVFGGNH